MGYRLWVIGLAVSCCVVTVEAQEVDSLGVSKSLRLPGVEVTAQRRTTQGTTSYMMDRTTLDHVQMINLSDVLSLLPGGKTVNSTLMDDDRITLRAVGTGEQGNAQFGTGIEVDGMRLDNNAMMDETQTASTRSLSSSNIGSVEVISGIAGVEYGDISNGIVKVNSRRGITPWVVEGSINPYTRQVAVHKGVELYKGGKEELKGSKREVKEELKGSKRGVKETNGASGRRSLGVLNFSLEHANSFSDTSSPYTAYQRNTFSLGYFYAIPKPMAGGKLTLHTVWSGNVGGYNSEADPDAFKDTYTKTRDNQLRGTVDLRWLRNSKKAGIFNVTLHGAFSTSDKRSEVNTNNSSSSAQPLIHTMQTGEATSMPYDDYVAQYGQGAGGIMLGPTGYWYTKCYNDQKPLTFQVKVKGEWTKVLRGSRGLQEVPGGSRRFQVVNKVMVGLEYNTSRNNGQGVYYEDIRYAADGWRPYVYSDLPTMKNLALFAEDKLMIGRLRITAGLRDDITMINGSGYGTLSSLSPRVTVQYSLPRGEDWNATFHAGFGKSVKLPSFQVLYPQDTYSDRLVASGSSSSSVPQYTYYTNVQKTLVNEALKWQSTNQVDVGVDVSYKRVKFQVSGFWHRTEDPYMRVNLYTPYTYTKTDATSGEEPYYTYSTNYRYTNGSPVTRYGLEWILDADICKATATRLVGLKLRLDGSYYHYKGVDGTMLWGTANGIGDMTKDQSTYHIIDHETGLIREAYGPLIGYYTGSNITSTGSSTISVANGSLSKGCNLNATITAQIPKARLIMTLKVETTFLNYKRALSEDRSAILLAAAGDVFGTKYNGETDHYVALYPETYRTWDDGRERPFAEDLQWAQANDPTLYKQLCNLIVRSNTSYYFNPADISAYFSCNFSITKEIGRMFSVSLYANNFLNNMHSVRNSQTGLESSLFASGYVPKFYYGASLRIKL